MVSRIHCFVCWCIDSEGKLAAERGHIEEGGRRLILSPDDAATSCSAEVYVSTLLPQTSASNNGLPTYQLLRTQQILSLFRIHVAHFFVYSAGNIHKDKAAIVNIQILY